LQTKLTSADDAAACASYTRDVEIPLESRLTKYYTRRWIKSKLKSIYTRLKSSQNVYDYIFVYIFDKFETSLDFND